MPLAVSLPSVDPTPPLWNIGRGVVILLLLGTVTFATLGFLGDFARIRELIQRFSRSTLALVLLLSAVNYGLRFARWQVYLRLLDVRLKPSRSLAVFLTGFLLSVTPGKAGELAKAWLSREFGGGPARPVVAVVVTERLLDVLAVLLLLGSSVLVFAGQHSVVALIVLPAAAAAVALTYGPLTRRLLPLLARTRFAAGRASLLLDIHQAFKPYYETTPVGENVDPQRLGELQHHLLERAIFAPADVTGFAKVWYHGRRDHSADDHRRMNAVLDAVVQSFQGRNEEEQEEFRGQLTAYRNLYAFLSQITPWQDPEFEQLYAFARNLLAKLPPHGDGRAFALEDEVGLQFFRLQQLSTGSIDLAQGEVYPLKGPTEVGTAGAQEPDVPLSSLIERINERFGTDFAEADQLFVEQIRASAESDEKIAEAARANTLPDFAAYLDRSLNELFIARMEGNEAIFSKLMDDAEIRSFVCEQLAREVFGRVRKTFPM